MWITLMTVTNWMLILLYEIGSKRMWKRNEKKETRNETKREEKWKERDEKRKERTRIRRFEDSSYPWTSGENERSDRVMTCDLIEELERERVKVSVSVRERWQECHFASFDKLFPLSLSIIRGYVINAWLISHVFNSFSLSLLTFFHLLSLPLPLSPSLFN